MASVVCPSYSGAAVLRATKVDGCCAPICEDPNNPGQSGQVTTDAFVSLAVAPGEGEEGGGGGGEGGEAVTKANGQVCMTNVVCAPPTEYTLTLTICALDPELILIMQPAWCAVRDSAGNVIGFTAKGVANCDSGFALETWLNVYSGAGGICEQGGATQHGYLLFPCITNVQIGEFTIQTGPITFQFTGRTKRGSNWGKGPYNVFMDQGRPSPLPCPVAPVDDFIQFLTTFPPPEAECGKQPVDCGIPEPPELYINGAAGQSRCTVELRPDNHGAGPVEVDWGDSTPVSTVRSNFTATHSYDAGNYNACDPANPRQVTITVRDKQYPQIATTRTITIPLEPDQPNITCRQDATDPSGKTVIVDAKLPSQAWCGPPDPATTRCACPGESPIGKYGLSVDWGDSAGPDRVQYVAVSACDGAYSSDMCCRATLRHEYETVGTYSIKVCRNDQRNLCSKCAFISGGGLRPVVRFVSWDDNCMATIAVENPDGGANVTINWGDGTPNAVQPNVPPGQYTHSFPNASGKSFQITVCATAKPNLCGTIKTPPCSGGGGLTITPRCQPSGAAASATVAGLRAGVTYTWQFVAAGNQALVSPPTPQPLTPYSDPTVADAGPAPLPENRGDWQLRVVPSTGTPVLSPQFVCGSSGGALAATARCAPGGASASGTITGMKAGTAYQWQFVAVGEPAAVAPAQPQPVTPYTDPTVADVGPVPLPSNRSWVLRVTGGPGPVDSTPITCGPAQTAPQFTVAQGATPNQAVFTVTNNPGHAKNFRLYYAEAPGAAAPPAEGAAVKQVNRTPGSSTITVDWQAEGLAAATYSVSVCWYDDAGTVRGECSAVQQVAYPAPAAR